MIQKTVFTLACVALLACTGCFSSNRIVGSNLHEESSWYGELGITGHLNEVVIRTGSTITKLSILGDANKVTVEDRVSLGKIEVWGENNVISIPSRLVVRVNKWGNGTRIHRRQPGEAPNFDLLETEPALEPETLEPSADEGYVEPAEGDGLE